MKNIIIAKRLIKIAKSLIADKKDVKGINHIPYNEHSMTAYHGSSSKLSKITPQELIRIREMSFSLLNTSDKLAPSP